MGQTACSWKITKHDMVFAKNFAVRDCQIITLKHNGPDEVTWGVRILYWRGYSVWPRYCEWRGSAGAFIPGRWKNG